MKSIFKKEDYMMNENWLGLDGQVVIVTGGASGIGKHVVDTLVKVGANAVAVDLNVKTGDELDGAYCVQCNVTDPESVNQMVQAGGGGGADIHTVNVKGVFLCAQAVARELVKQGHGVILNMSSESGKEGSQGQSAYSATKGAVDSFTRSWAKELGKYNVRVVACAPGIMEATGLRTTAYNEALAYTRGVKPEDLSTDYSKVIPIGRDGKLDEVGSLVAYLVSDQASYITGTTVNISGGKSRG